MACFGVNPTVVRARLDRGLSGAPLRRPWAASPSVLQRRPVDTETRAVYRQTSDNLYIYKYTVVCDRWSAADGGGGGVVLLEP